MKSIDSWLPKLSEQLSYVPKTYPILVHGVLASFDTSHEGEDIADLIQQNTDAITHPPALQRAELLVKNGGHMSHRTRGSLVLHFDNPVIANNCIDWHIALFGGLLPVVKHIRPPP